MNQVQHPIPANEKERLAELHSLHLLYSDEEDAYNDIAALVAFIADCPTGHVSIIGAEVQWLKAKVGAGDLETPREHAFCSHAIVQDGIMVIEDATQDQRFANNPLVTGPQHLRFYAGVPIYSPAGFAIGTVCALDNKPKTLNDAQKNAIRLVANQASQLIELRKKNLQIARMAEEQIQLERSTLSHQIVQQEKERELIGYELHEDFCQILAACMHQLAAIGSEYGMAKPLQDVRQELGLLLQRMRNLSTSISPVGRITIGVEEKIRQMLREFAQISGLSIHFQCDGDPDEVGARNMTQLFRIMYEWLSVYGTGNGESNPVAIHLTVEDKVTLCIRHTDTRDQALVHNAVTINAISKRCEVAGGKASVTATKEGMQLQVNIPL